MRKFNKLQKMSLALLVAVVMVFSTALGLKIGMDNQDEAKITQYTEDIYYIKEYKGKIAVFHQNDLNTPLRTMDVYVNELRKADAQKIKDGIKIESLTELATVLEDYCS